VSAVKIQFDNGTSLDYTLTVTDGSSNITVAYIINLNEGVNLITAHVTAQDGTTTRDYSIAVTRAAADIVISGGGGGGAVPIPEVGQLATTSGGTISILGTTIVIPANATSTDIRVNVEKVMNISGLPIGNNSKLVSDVFEITKDKSADFTKPVTISLTFDKTNVDTGKYELFLCWFDTSTNKWVKLDNIQIDMAKGKISGDVNHFTKFAVIAIEKKVEVNPEVSPQAVTEANFNDIKGHWAEESIRNLAISGAIMGYPDSSFKPDASITRAEFATMLVKALGLNTSGTTGKFTDVTADAWYYGFVNAAASASLVSGMGDNLFAPNTLITREQMAVMVTKALGNKAPTINGTELNAFGDKSAVSSWAVSGMEEAVKASIVSGMTPSTIAPQADATRAQAAEMIYKMLSVLGK
jgi:hypothetical protein